MTDLLMPRRKFLTGLFGLVAAPAVVKAASLMPVRYIPQHLHELDGVGLTTLAHPYPRLGSGINLAQIREMLMPGLQQMVDGMYTEHPGLGKFLSVKT
jgi:hypothetical protein